MIKTWECNELSFIFVLMFIKCLPPFNKVFSFLHKMYRFCAKIFV